MKKQLLFLTSLGLLGSGYSQAVPCGNSSNAYSVLRPAQNQVAVDTATQTIMFIHRQDISISGGTTADNGKLNYSFSTDGGLSFTNNIGVLNSTYTRPARYPQVALYNPSNSSNVGDLKAVYTGPTLASGGSGWDGHVAGVKNVVASNPTGTENYFFTGSNTALGGGLVQRVPGEFWMCESTIVNDTLIGDSVIVYRGIYNTTTNDVDWLRNTSLTANLYKGYDGRGRLTSFNMAFSPDGQNGWIAGNGDLVGGADSVYQPVLWRTVDGGQSWTGPIGVELMSIPGLMDSLNFIQYLDGTSGLVISAAAATCSFDYDITVDANGNPHFFTIVMVGEIRDENNGVVGNGKGYSVYPGMNKYAADITSTNGGATWQMKFISPVSTFRTEWTPDLSTDNQPQVGRSADGQYIFYSWADTDTLLVGQQNANSNPNLRVAATRISDGFQTCYRRVESNQNEDNVLAPTMAPIVFQTGSTYYPTVVSGQLTVDDLSPTNFFYMGNLARMCESDFQDPATIDLSWSFTGGCYTHTFCQGQVSIEEQAGTVRASLYPNPAKEQLTVLVEQNLKQVEGYTITNLAGQQVASENIREKGMEGHYLNLDISNLPNGFYILNLISNGKGNAYKFAVSK